MTDDGDTVGSYGTCGFTPDPDAPDFVPFAQLDETTVLTWIHANGVDKDAIEASLAANIEAQKNPTQSSGVPW
jgi:hypothetical protein